MVRELIRDITPADEIPAYSRGYGQKRQAHELKTEVMVEELYGRGIPIERIFQIYYSLEEMASHRDDEIFGSDEAGQHGRSKLTVSDAILVTGRGIVQVKERPF